MYCSCVLTREGKMPAVMKCKGAPPLDAATLIKNECDTVLAMLLEKNRKYGNSALEPARVFSKASPVEQIKVRIDDKLSRMQSAQLDDAEDVVQDLIGYLILLRIAGRNAKAGAT